MNKWNIPSFINVFVLRTWNLLERNWTIGDDFVVIAEETGKQVQLPRQYSLLLFSSLLLRSILWMNYTGEKYVVAVFIVSVSTNESNCHSIRIFWWTEFLEKNLNLFFQTHKLQYLKMEFILFSFCFTKINKTRCTNYIHYQMMCF